MSSPDLDLGDVDRRDLVATLRRAGASFALVHGSRVHGAARADSDVDVAAWLPPGTHTWEVLVPDRVDLIDLRGLSLPIAGRIAVDGVLLFDDDPRARVRWQADTRQRYFDEAHRRRWIAHDALTAASGG